MNSPLSVRALHKRQRRSRLLTSRRSTTDNYSNPAQRLVKFENADISRATQITIPFNSSSGSCFVQVNVGKRYLSLPDFLRKCADSLDREHAVSTAFVEKRNSFVSGGMSRLNSSRTLPKWIQMGLQLGPEEVDFNETCNCAASVARGLMHKRLVSNFFFMNKPPGLRLRFEASDLSNLAPIKKTIESEIAKLQRRGAVKCVVPAVYEPESHLFGGDSSMKYVHQLFTLDSFAWLDFYRLANSRQNSAPLCAFSLALLYALFNALGISGWEHMDVWERVRNKTGRSLPAEWRTDPEFRSTALEIRSAWQEKNGFFRRLSSTEQRIVSDYCHAIQPVVEKWCTEYFWTADACVGPREAAAFVTIFHWNRARLPLTRQAMLTEALAFRDAN